MKALLVFLLIAIVSAESFLDPYEDNYELFLRGFFNGIDEAGDPIPLINCIGHMENIKKKVKKAIEYIIQLTYVDVVKGIRLLAAAAREFHKKLDACLTDYPNLKRLVDAVINFDGAQIIIKLVFKFAKFLRYTLEALSSFQRNDFYGFGRYNGLIAKNLFLDNYALKLTNETVLNFTTGLLKALGEKKSPEPLLKCLYKLDKTLLKIMQGFKLIRTGTLDNIVKGSKIVLEGIREIFIKGSPCFNGYEKLQLLVIGIRQITFDELLIRVINNFQRIVLDIDFAINGFDRGDFESAGKGIGDLLKYLFLP